MSDRGWQEALTDSWGRSGDGYPPSSLALALLKAGALVHLIERRDIEGRLPQDIAHNLVCDRFWGQPWGDERHSRPRPSISKASPRHRTTIIRLRRPMAASPRKGAFEMV
jgi:hypothetical protein